LKKEHLGFFIFFAGIIAIFLWRLITMHGLFIAGDNLVQFYPWSKVYSGAIKGLNLPFWCRYFHSGFPIMAEGQIGGLYPVNVLMYLCLPFKIAYNYSVVLHFILAGIFTYFYTRRLGAGQWGGALAALLFCFGSAYAGCFYNIITLRTLVWFPLVLLLIDIYADSKRPAAIIACGLIAGMQFLAGFIQMAAYSFMFYMIYMMYIFRIRRVAVKERVFPILIFSILTFLITLPQLALTYGLVQVSGRSSASIGFALWRSFSPLGFLTSVFPYWLRFTGHQVYIGVFGILFLIYAIAQLKDFKQIRPIVLVGLFALFAALGKYNPLYVGLLKITGFYGFRNPSKFLFFSLFAASVLSGFGFSIFFNRPNVKLTKIVSKAFAVIMASSLAVFFASMYILRIFKENILLWMKDYVSRFIIGKPYHRYDLETYMDKIHNIYSLLINGTDLGDIFVLSSVLFVSVALITGIAISMKRYNNLRFLRLPIYCLIFIDIFTYSYYGTGFRGNIKDLGHIRPSHANILKVLRADTSLFRILPLDLKDEDMPWWTRPNANILVGLDSIAAYTPLIEKDYKEYLSSLEIVDDSLGLISPSDDALSKHYQDLRILNVKYLISARPLSHNFLEEIARQEEVILYGLKGNLPRIFFTDKLSGEISAGLTEAFNLVEYNNGIVTAELIADRDGFVVFSENYYPGWEAFIDDRPAEIILVKGLIQAVRIDRGRHKVIFKFNPKFF